MSEEAMSMRELEEIEEQVKTLLNTHFADRLDLPKLFIEVRRSRAEAAELRKRVGELEWLAKIAKRFVRNHREGGISLGYKYLASAVDALDVEEVSNDELRAATSARQESREEEA